MFTRTYLKYIATYENVSGESKNFFFYLSNDTTHFYKMQVWNGITSIRDSNFPQNISSLDGQVKISNYIDNTFYLHNSGSSPVILKASRIKF